jgi:very-short-patch-repair endonuclease
MATKRSTVGSRSANDALAEVAERQHGVVSLGQLREMGASESRIRGLVNRRALRPVHRGVYAVGHKRLPAEGWWMAAVLACGSGAVLSHRSAGRLWRMSRSRGPVEVTRPKGWRSPAGVFAHRLPCAEDEWTVRDGIPVTGVSRTLLDLATVVSRRQLENALNEAEVLRLTDSVSLPRLLARYPRRRGTAVLRAILADEDALGGPTLNDFEERFAVLLAEHDLPKPRFNADLVVRGRHFNVDCLWSKRRLIVELDGGAVHGTARAFEADRERDRILAADGWQVVRVTWRQLSDDSVAVVEDVRRALHRRPAPPPTL